jgi:hypothetical protein
VRTISPASVFGPPAQVGRLAGHGHRFDGDGAQSIDGQAFKFGASERPWWRYHMLVRLRADHQQGAAVANQPADGCRCAGMEFGWQRLQCNDLDNQIEAVLLLGG